MQKKHEHVEEKYWKINFKILSKTSWDENLTLKIETALGMMNKGLETQK